jgi:hypothetical protein
LNVDIVSCENIRHVLLHADNKSTNDLISDLEDIEQEDLCVAWEEAFKAACICFTDQLQEKGITEKQTTY